MTQNHAEDPKEVDGLNLTDIQPLEAVAERGIDLFLIEELNVDSSSRSWF
jgi:hypothetical protein